MFHKECKIGDINNTGFPLLKMELNRILNYNNIGMFMLVREVSNLKLLNTLKAGQEHTVGRYRPGTSEVNCIDDIEITISGYQAVVGLHKSVGRFVVSGGRIGLFCWFVGQPPRRPEVLRKPTTPW